MAFRLPLTSLNVNLSNLPVEDRRFPASQNLKLEDIPKQLDDNDCRFVTSDQQNHKEVHFPFSSREGAGIEQDGTGEVEYFPNMADVSSTEILFSFWEGPVRTFESAGHAFMLTPANKASVQEANADVELESPAELCGKGVGGLWQESEGGSPVPALSPATIELLCGLSLSGSCSGAPTHTSAAVALPPAVLEGLFSPGLDGGGGEGSATPGMTPGPLEPAPGGSGGRPSPFARLQRRFAFATPLTGWSEAASPSPPRQGGAQDGEEYCWGA
uniref:Uncharacterized protein n=1 Tax=Tetraselmis sp. GSL018 TaxID=582737 RepID=A0A061QTX2_9CHLO